MKILCLLLPHFPWRCEVLRQPVLKGRHAVLTSMTGSQKLVLDFSPGLEGLQRDMSLQQALARYGEVELLAADIYYYRAVSNQLLAAIEEISPLVEGMELGCVYIGIDGLQFIYPDDDAIVVALRKSVPQALDPRIGIAGNKFLAYLAASRCRPGEWLVFSSDVDAFLRDLPCDVLPVSRKSKEKLHQFGLHTLGQLAALSLGPLLSQFGPEGKRVHDLVRGYDDTPLYPRMMGEVIDESTTLSSVTVSLESILVALEELLRSVFVRISRVGLGVRTLAVWTRTWESEQWERIVRFKEPAMDIKTVINRIKRVMEEYPQPCPVEQIGLNISRLGYPGGRQNSLFREVRSQDHLMENIHQLELRLGKPQVYQVKEVEPWSRIPERRYMLAPTNR